MGTETAGEGLLKTPLYDTHVTYKGKIVPFAGYLLPVQYETGVIEEHMAVRTKCGLFDVSHMGDLRLRTILYHRKMDSGETDQNV